MGSQDEKFAEIFMGWSLSAVTVHNSEYVSFTDTETVSKARFEEVMAEEIAKGRVAARDQFTKIVRGTKVHLYAVWETYRFSEDDTIIKMNVGQDQFRIDDYGIVPTRQLKNLVMVNFGNPS